MKLSELQRMLEDLAVKVGPDLDPEIIIRSKYPWKFLREVEMDKIATVEAVKDVVALK